MIKNQPFAVFDLDGTLIRWQLYHAMVDRLAKNGHLKPGTYEKVQESRMNWKIRQGPDGFRVYEQELIKLFSDSLDGLDGSAYDSACQEVFEQYKDQVYTYSRDLIKNLKAKGYLIFAISGSNEELVGRIANYYGFDDFVGSKYKRDSKTGKLMSGSENVFVASRDKAAVLSSLVKKHSLSFDGSYAVGDTVSDAPMLEMCQNAIAVNPDKKLYKIATEKGWKIIVERKNVIYEIQ